MHSSPGNERFSKGSEIVENTLRLKETIAMTKKHMIWGFVNFFLTLLLAYNMSATTVDDTLKTYLIYNGQFVVAAVLMLNACFHLVQYIWKTVSLNPICLSPTQRKMLGIGHYDRYFKPIKPLPRQASRESPPFTATFPMNLSVNGWLSPAAFNESTSPNRSTFAANTSWVPQPSVPYFSNEEPITDQASFSRYLDAVEEHERRAAGGVSFESPSTSFGSFWQTPSPRSDTSDVSPLLSRCAYQTSPVTPVTPSSSPGVLTDDGASPTVISHTEFWRRVKVDPNKLTQWNANLRMWMSLTILQRLVAELDNIDAAFVRCGLSDLHLGSVGLDRLKRTASIPQVVASIPSLPRLVPFLELSPHQEYLVTRIRELAKGGSMSEFRWNSGGSLHGKPWEEHLPTDAALVMHLIVTYLDLQLLPTIQRADATPARPFSSQYYVRSPERPPTRPFGLIIYQSQLNPPHFVLMERDVFDVPKGRNNVFHTFLLFLHLLKTREYGMLGPLNLGRSGVNVLWVVES